MNVLNRRDKAIIFLVLLFMMSYPYVLSQTPPGPNTLEHGEGINTPTITTDHYYLGTTGPAEITDRLQGTWDVGISSPYVNGSEFYHDSVNRTDTFQYPELGYSYKVFSAGGTVYVKNASSGQIDFAGINGSYVVQSAINSMNSGTILFADLIDCDTTITGKNSVDLVGLNRETTGLRATASMTNLLEYGNLPLPSLVKISNLLLEGDGKVDVLVDGGREVNQWIQIRIIHCYLKRAKVALVNATNVDGFRILDSVLLGSDDAGTSLITDYGLICSKHNGRIFVDQSILVSFNVSHINFKGRRLSISHTNFATILPPTGPYVFLEGVSGVTPAEVDMISVHMETPVDGTPQSGLIEGSSVEPPSLELTNCWMGLNSNSYPLIEGELTRLNIMGGRYGQVGSYAYVIDADIEYLFMFCPDMNKGANLSKLVKWHFRRQQETISWSSNYERRIPTQSFSGNAAKTAFGFLHYLNAAPVHVEIGKKHADIISLGWTWTSNSTHITITFESAPPSGTNNVVFSWRAST